MFTCLANAQDYSKLFNSLDSVQKSQAVDHLRKIKKLINYEIIKSGIKVGEKEFIKGVFFIDKQGKFSVIIIDDKSKKYNDIISNIDNNHSISELRLKIEQLSNSDDLNEIKEQLNILLNKNFSEDWLNIKDMILDNLSNAYKIQSETIVMHSSSDEIIPISHAMKLYNCIKKNKKAGCTFLEVDKIKHN